MCSSVSRSIHLDDFFTDITESPTSMQPCSFSLSIYRSTGGLIESHSSQGGCHILPSPNRDAVIDRAVIDRARHASQTQLGVAHKLHSLSEQEKHSPYLTDEESGGQSLNRSFHSQDASKGVETP